ncbi:MAG: diaminopimelate epimerase, partial [Deltaproteobacteria bacterium]|nr:diaminopimelate epimerase [Deltaproteobacteria bacterium]
MTKIPFCKMNGSGNDFILIDNRSGAFDAARTAKFVRRVCTRKVSVGADGLIFIEPGQRSHFRWRFFNADGSEAEGCGNGIRCVAKYIYDHGYTSKTSIRIETLAGILSITLHVSNSRVEGATVDMGCPRLQRREIPMVGPEGQVIGEEIEAAGRKFKVTAVSMGNPHCVIFVDKVADFPVDVYGPLIESHPVFPSRTNVE